MKLVFCQPEYNLRERCGDVSCWLGYGLFWWHLSSVISSIPFACRIWFSLYLVSHFLFNCVGCFVWLPCVRMGWTQLRISLKRLCALFFSSFIGCPAFTWINRSLLVRSWHPSFAPCLQPLLFLCFICLRNYSSPLKLQRCNHWNLGMDT